MTERTPMDPFEQRFARLARAYTQPAAQPIDPLATARAAMSAPARRWAPLERVRWPSLDRRLLLVLVAAGLVTALAALALAGGSTPAPRDPGPGRIVLVRDGDLFVAEIDGTGMTRIGDGGADGTQLGYLAAVWSPDMRHIAAVRDLGGPFLTPAIEILAADGTAEQSIEPGPGGTPSLSWSPDSQHLAIATYPADLRRDAADPQEVPLRLAIVGLDGASRDVALPQDAAWFGSAQPEIWTVPDLSVRWSPDGRWIAAAWDDTSSLSRWHLVAADGSAARPLNELVEGRCPASADSIDWFPDGRRLATVGGVAGHNELCVEALGSRGGRPGATPEPGTVAVIEDDPSSSEHGKLNLPGVAPDGDRIAVSTFMDDFDLLRHVTTLRVYDLASGRATDVASGTETLVLEANGVVHATGVLDGTPVSFGGFAWAPDARRLLYLSPEPGSGPGRWTVRGVDAGGGPSSIVADGVRSFDLGYVH